MSSKPKVLITAIDGHTGTAIAHHITQNSSVKEALGGICGIAEKDECKSLKDAGICVQQIDTLCPPDKMLETFKRIDVVVLIPSALSNKTKHVSNMLEACQSAGVKKLVLISIAGCDLATGDQTPQLGEFQKIESQVKQLKFDAVTLRPNFYTENLLLYKSQMKEGKLPLPIGDGKMAPAFLKDVAESVCLLLKDETKFKENLGKAISLTGPELLTGQQMAERLSSGIGKKIEFQDISKEEAKKILWGVKELDESEAQLLLEFYCLVKAGKADFCEPYAFEKLTGHAPTPLQDFFKHHKITMADKA